MSNFHLVKRHYLGGHALSGRRSPRRTSLYNGMQSFRSSARQKMSHLYLSSDARPFQLRDPPTLPSQTEDQAQNLFEPTAFCMYMRSGCEWKNCAGHRCDHSGHCKHVKLHEFTKIQCGVKKPHTWGMLNTAFLGTIFADLANVECPVIEAEASLELPKVPFLPQERDLELSIDCTFATSSPLDPSLAWSVRTRFSEAGRQVYWFEQGEERESAVQALGVEGTSNQDGKYLHTIPFGSTYWVQKVLRINKLLNLASYAEHQQMEQCELSTCQQSDSASCLKEIETEINAITAVQEIFAWDRRRENDRALHRSLLIVWRFRQVSQPGDVGVTMFRPLSTPARNEKHCLALSNPSDMRTSHNDDGCAYVSRESPSDLIDYLQEPQYHPNVGQLGSIVPQSIDFDPNGINWCPTVLDCSYNAIESQNHAISTGIEIINGMKTWRETASPSRFAHPDCSGAAGSTICDRRNNTKSVLKQFQETQQRLSRMTSHDPPNDHGYPKENVGLDTYGSPETSYLVSDTVNPCSSVQPMVNFRTDSRSLVCSNTNNADDSNLSQSMLQRYMLPEEQLEGRSAEQPQPDGHSQFRPRTSNYVYGALHTTEPEMPMEKEVAECLHIGTHPGEGDDQDQLDLQTIDVAATYLDLDHGPTQAGYHSPTAQTYESNFFANTKRAGNTIVQWEG